MVVLSATIFSHDPTKTPLAGQRQRGQRVDRRASRVGRIERCFVENWPPKRALSVGSS